MQPRLKRPRPATRPPGAARRREASRTRRSAPTVPGMLFGYSLHSFIVTGLAAVVFILLLKGLVAPHLPAGAQKLIGSV
jgi:hypothetical protein